MVGRNNVQTCMNIFFVFSLLFLFFPTAVFSMSPMSQLEQLVKENKASQDDVLLLLNVLYNSYERSASLIDAQYAYHHHLQITGLVGNYLVTTRRNPSKTVLEIPSIESIAQSAQSCAHSFDRYKNAANLYVQCSEYAIKNNGFKKEQLHALVVEFRTQVKYAILNTIKTYYDTIQSLYYELSSKTDKSKQFNNVADAADTVDAAEQVETEKDELEIVAEKAELEAIAKKGFLQTLITSLPFFAEKVFITVDEKYIVLNQKLWDFSFRNGEAYAHIWNVIEQQRAKLYLDAYRSIVFAAIAKNPRILTHAQLFGELGIVEPKHRKDLPAPIELTISL
jgi:hypothetical protein